MTTIYILLSIAYSLNWYLHQLDINTTFFHEDLEEDVYMKPPPGLNVPLDMVCKLNKSLYGLKQASRQWNHKITTTLIDIGFAQSKSDYSLFTKKSNNDFTIVLVYTITWFLQVLIYVKSHLSNIYWTRNLA